MIDGTLDGGALMVTCWSVAALSRAAKKISEPPSGDHAGDHERPVRVTSRTISPVAALKITTSLPFLSILVAATHRPSGLTAGSMNPFAPKRTIRSAATSK
jgi:hypothetical protein